uniref:Metalloendopeptidase n=1 Tax=Globodera pallida TaxID=36090 RepID=A0A183BYC1_GLOPA
MFPFHLPNLDTNRRKFMRHLSTKRFWIPLLMSKLMGEDLKPFELPPWDNTSLPSTNMPSNDTRTEDPLEAGDVLYTKEQAQGQHDYLAEMCSKCRNSSQSEKVLRRQKRQFLRAAKKWEKFPIPIRFDTVSLGEGIIHADTTIRYGAAWISEHTCVDFTFDETNDRDGIEIIYNGDPTICGNSKLGRVGGWQHLSINCGEMYTGAHELLHALGVQHEDQRFDRDRYIKMNPLSKEFLHSTKDDGFPYDYGSIMHYPPNIKNHAYDKISLNRFYQQSMGQTDKPSFRDYAVINHAYCEGKCGPEFWCKNGGYPNPRFCSECECPWGYEGNHCENLQRDFNCNYKMEGNRELEADWQTRTLDTLIHCWSEKCVCVWRITPKEGKKLRIQLKRLEIEDTQCSHRPCQKSFIEINFRKDKRARGARFCCPDAIALVSPAQNWIEAEEAGTDIIISTSLAYWHKPVVLVLTYETDGAKIVAAEDCPDPRELFFKERNPGGSVSCHKPEDTNKDIPCSRAAIPFNCDAFNPGYFAWINGYRTNKTVITMECFKREDNPTSYWGYWANKTQDPIHIDDIQCVKYVREPKFKSAEVEDSAKVEDSFKNANGSTVYMGYKNPGGSVSCHKPEDTNKDIPCSRAAIPFNCDAFNPGYFAWINGYRTNKTVITMECFKREDNPTSYWGYWANKTQDPIHIDDIQCVKYVREPKFKSAEVEDSAKVEDSFKNANGSTVYMGYKYVRP